MAICSRRADIAAAPDVIQIECAQCARLTLSLVRMRDIVHARTYSYPWILCRMCICPFALTDVNEKSSSGRQTSKSSCFVCPSGLRAGVRGCYELYPLVPQKDTHRLVCSKRLRAHDANSSPALDGRTVTRRPLIGRLSPSVECFRTARAGEHDRDPFDR